MNPQQVPQEPMIREVGSLVLETWDKELVVSSEVSPSTQPFVDSFVLHYGEYREREREGRRETECRRDRRAQIYLYIYRSTRADIRTSFSIRDRKWLRANWRALCALLLRLGPPLPAQLFGVSRVTDHARVVSSSSSGKLAPLS